MRQARIARFEKVSFNQFEKDWKKCFPDDPAEKVRGIYDAIKLFDKAVGPWQLTRLRLHVFWQNLFN